TLVIAISNPCHSDFYTTLVIPTFTPTLVTPTFTQPLSFRLLLQRLSFRLLLQPLSFPFFCSNDCHSERRPSARGICFLSAPSKSRFLATLGMTSRLSEASTDQFRSELLLANGRLKRGNNRPPNWHNRAARRIGSRV